MELQDFADVHAICEAGSFRRAARQLGVAQPTLSHRIQRLEGRLGIKLFDRGRGHCRPTALALHLSSGAAKFLDEAGALAHQANRLARGLGGEVRLGCGPAPAYAFLAELMRSIRSGSDSLRATAYLGATEQLASLLREGVIDLAICPADDGVFDDNFESHLLNEWPIEIAAAPGHPVLEAPDSLFDYPLALPVLEPGYLQLAREYFGRNLDESPDVVFCSDFGVLLDLVQNGVHISAGPAFAFRRDVDKGRLETAVLDARITHRLHLTRRRGDAGLPILERVEAGIRALTT